MLAYMDVRMKFSGTLYATRGWTLNNLTLTHRGTEVKCQKYVILTKILWALEWRGAPKSRWATKPLWKWRLPNGDQSLSLWIRLGWNYIRGGSTIILVVIPNLCKVTVCWLSAMERIGKLITGCWNLAGAPPGEKTVTSWWPGINAINAELPTPLLFLLCNKYLLVVSFIVVRRIIC